MKHSRLAGIAGLTHVGRRRRNNEDAIAWDAELGLALVADGVGGGNAGEIASATAARSISGDLRRAMLETDGTNEPATSRASQAALIQELVRRANDKIVATAAREPRFHGMGTTLAVALLAADFMTTASVGDSRVYRMRAGMLTQLTRDHRVTDELAARGQLSASQTEYSLLRNTLSRALGMVNSPTADIEHHSVESGDLFMLCTDGLTKAIGDRELAELLSDAGQELRDSATTAVALANARGGHDNVSIILLRIA